MAQQIRDQKGALIGTITESNGKRTLRSGTGSLLGTEEKGITRDHNGILVARGEGSLTSLLNK